MSLENTTQGSASNVVLNSGIGNIVDRIIVKILENPDDRHSNNIGKSEDGFLTSDEPIKIKIKQDSIDKLFCKIDN